MAQQYQERVVKASERLLGEEHPHTLAAINNLALTRKAQGDYRRFVDLRVAQLAPLAHPR